eukprot:SAG31_NODE_25774_length_454_cov_1.416901_2_plen_42_part_01
MDGGPYQLVLSDHAYRSECPMYVAATQLREVSRCSKNSSLYA